MGRPDAGWWRKAMTRNRRRHTADRRPGGGRIRDQMGDLLVQVAAIVTAGVGNAARMGWPGPVFTEQSRPRDDQYPSGGGRQS